MAFSNAHQTLVILFRRILPQYFFSVCLVSSADHLPHNVVCRQIKSDLKDIRLGVIRRMNLHDEGESLKQTHK